MSTLEKFKESVQAREKKEAIDLLKRARELIRSRDLSSADSDELHDDISAFLEEVE
jgi:hypothetical protein